MERLDVHHLPIKSPMNIPVATLKRRCVCVKVQLNTFIILVSYTFIMPKCKLWIFFRWYRGFLFVGWCVDLGMIRYLSLLLFIGLAFWGCENKGIINGGYYKNDNMDRINTYHLYDFISIEKVKKHAMESAYTTVSYTHLTLPTTPYV